MSKLGTLVTSFSSAALVLASCARNPATGKLQLNFVSKDQEIALGKQGAEEVKSTIGYYGESAELEQYVQALGNKLAAVSDRPKLPWSFHVVDDASVNAFALPGGQIYVTRGILANLENEAQLATVMGHEVGHVTARHTANQMSKATLAELGLGIGAALSDTVRTFLPIGSAGLQLLFLKFSRDDESQADALGLRYALRAGYDVREMPKVFAMLKRVSDEAGGGKLPTWLQTHPEPTNRIEATNKRIAKLDTNLDGLAVREDRLMEHVDGIVYGDNPREGFFKGNTFYQPELRFQVTFPEGWKKQNTKQAVIAASPDDTAAMQLTLAAHEDPEAALDGFLSQSGVTVRKQPAHEGQGVAASFTASTDQGDVEGLVGYVDHGGHTYQVITIAAPGQLAAHEDAFSRVMSTFETVTDPAILAVAPKRVHVDKLTHALSIEELHQEHPSLSVEELSLMNQVSPSATLRAGESVKYVAPGSNEPTEPGPLASARDAADRR